MLHIKKNIKLITPFLCVLILLSVGYAEDIASPITLLSSKLVSMMNLLASIVFGIAIATMLVASFSYVMSEGDNKRMEQAKNRILNSGIGMMMTMFAMFLLKIINTMYGVTETETEPTNIMPIWVILLIPIFGVIGYLIYRITTNDNQTTEKEKSKASKVRLSYEDFQSFVEEAYQQTNQFSDTKNVFKKEETEVFFTYYEDKMNLRFMNKGEVCLDSTYLILSKQHIADFPPNYEWNTEKQTITRFLLDIHTQWEEDNRLEHFSVQDWTNHYLKLIHSDEIASKVAHLLERTHHLMTYHAQLNHEDIHLLETTLPSDFHQLVQSYHVLSESKKKTHESSFIDSLTVLQKRLDEIEEKIDTKFEQDAKYAFRIIDKRYNLKED